ncbi:MAG: hypothetical protein AAFX87_17685 [Bacteroidota bacterium]
MGRTDSVIFSTDFVEYIQTQKTEFDSNGNFSKRDTYVTNRDDGGNVKTTLISSARYDSLDTCTYELYYDHGKLKSFSISEDRSANQPEILRHYSHDSTLLYYVKLQYNAENRLIKTIKYNADSSRYGEGIFEYDYPHTLASKEELYVADTLYETINRVFEDCYSVSKEINYYAEDDKKVIIDHKFNDDRLPVSFTIKGYEDTNDKVWVYVYE